MGRNLRGEEVPDITLERARSLGLALETVPIRGVAIATGYAGKKATDYLELGDRVRDWMWWIRL